jgi:hypothetical protein
MTTNNSPSEESQVVSAEKKPYEKPAFRYERVFVTSALSCTKTGTESLCQHGSLSAS